MAVSPRSEWRSCDGSLRTTDQRTGRVWTPQRAHRPPVDCFYLYPTVSTQTGMNATLAIEAAQRSIAEYQAARSRPSAVVAPCTARSPWRAWAESPPGRTGGPPTAAFRAGWRAHLHRYNHGRGFVLIGHSQGSYLLRKLITREIDDNPALMRRFAGAVPTGHVDSRAARTPGGWGLPVDPGLLPAARGRMSRVGPPTTT